jgi:hypothetical protein
VVAGPRYAFNDVSSIYIYRAQDVDFVIEQINTTATAWQSFWFVLNEHPARNNALRTAAQDARRPSSAEQGARGAR